MFFETSLTLLMLITRQGSLLLCLANCYAFCNHHYFVHPLFSMASPASDTPGMSPMQLTCPLLCMCVTNAAYMPSFYVCDQCSLHYTLFLYACVTTAAHMPPLYNAPMQLTCPLFICMCVSDKQLQPQRKPKPR